MLSAQGHRYRNICDLRKGAATSLISVEFASHTLEESYSNDRVPSGFPFTSVKAALCELDFIFLNRFIQELLQYVSVMLALQPPLIQQQIHRSGVPALATSHGAEAAHTEIADLSKEAQQRQPEETSAASLKSSTEVGAVLQLDIEMEAPVISMPRSSSSADSLQMDLGYLRLHNTVKWKGGSGKADAQVK